MRILAISVHPDDETLGCGGTLLKHSAQGDTLFWIILTQMHEPQWSAEEIRRAATQVEQVDEAYGMKQHFQLDFPTAQLDRIPQLDLIERIRDVISIVKPELIYLIHDGDVHTDHHAAFTAAFSVLKPSYMHKLGVRRILCYETLSSTEAAPLQPHRLFIPTVYFDITPYIDQKINIFKLYKTEIQQDPQPRGPSSIRALARYRGATIGIEYAESFMLIREVE
ncbi:PIG-L deacetylase family protein [Chloroflexota bacterium]